MSNMRRRQFLKQSLWAGSAAFAISGTRFSGRVLGANDRVRIAVAGINGRGQSHYNAYAKIKNVEVACLVDPDSRLFGIRSLDIEKKTGKAPRCEQDIRRVLEDQNIDAVSVATCNHWHALITIWACAAGKDVYVEKPCSHNVHEGRIAVETARKYNRIVQHGTQSRASDRWARVSAYARSGALGRLLIARGLCYKSRSSIGFMKPEAPPKGLDFDLWLGPAPKQPFHRNLVHYNWHWNWDTGNGDIGNQGVHQIDVARWGIPNATLPKSVISLGGRFGYKDQGQTPNTQIAVFDYGDTQLIFEVRGLPTGKFHNETIGNVFHFEQGVIVGGRFFPNGSDQPADLPKVEVKRSKGNIFENFIDAVRTRRRESLHADILEGHYSSALCHLANISYRLGEEVPFNKSTQSLGDDKATVETFQRMADHLKDNRLKLDSLTYRLGRRLEIDAARETIKSDPEASTLLSRSPRPPFVVPEKVL